LAGIAQR